VSSHPLIGDPDPVTAIGGRFVSMARRARTPTARVSLKALAAVTSESWPAAGTPARGAAAHPSSVLARAELIGTRAG
jgi:hypothetical protein